MLLGAATLPAAALITALNTAAAAALASPLAATTIASQMRPASAR